MKKIIVLAFLVAFAIGGTHEFATSGLTQGGFKFGIGATDIRPEGDSVTVESFSPEISGRFGAFFTINFMEYIAIEPGLFGAMKHGSAKSMTSNFPGSRRYYRNPKMLIVHMEMPLLLKLMYNFEDAGVQPVIFAGPVFNYNIYHHYSYNGYKEDHLPQKMDNIPGIDVSLATGIGTEFAVGKGRIVLNFRYDIGLTSVHHGDKEYDVFTDVFTAEIGYAFRR